MDPSYSNVAVYGHVTGVNQLPYTEETNTWFQDDGIWLISCSFSIWTMVSGFGLLESGRVSSKDEVNIMVKNIVDVVFGGLSYWMLGFGFTFGQWYPNPVIGLGSFFFDPDNDGQPSDQAWHYSRFFFQMSFATTTSTIVSAAMAERIRLKPYIVITFLMTINHSIAAHWVWSEDGFLKKFGTVDAAGCSVVHLVGGVAGLAATLYLKPRQARFGERGNAHMSNPTNALLGTFMLWWGWLAFNTGSTMGVARGRWRLAARSAMVTLLSSLGGGCTSILISLISTRKCQIDLLIDGLLASLVATTAACHSIRPMDAIAIGAIGSALALSVYPLIERLEIDDPVGVIPVHVVGAIWGMLAVGIFSREDPFLASHGNSVTGGKNGLLYSGNFDLLIAQAVGVASISTFSVTVTSISLVIMNQFPWGLRMTKYEEQLGADLIEHGLAGHNIAKYSIEKKLNVKNAYSLVRYIAKWRRKVRLSRERRLAEAAEARGENSEAAKEMAERKSSVEPLRLGPLKLGILRRQSNQPPGGTLTGRPGSGRPPIEKDKNSLPPMHSSRQVVHHPLAHTNTSLDLASAIMPNGISGNGSVPFGRPITVVRPPSSATVVETPGPSSLSKEENNNNNEDSAHSPAPNSGGRERGGFLSRFRRNTRVQPHVQQQQGQAGDDEDELQLREQRNSEPHSARSFTSSWRVNERNEFDDAISPRRQSTRQRRPDSAGGGSMNNPSQSGSTRRRHQQQHSPRNINDSIV